MMPLYGEWAQVTGAARGQSATVGFLISAYNAESYIAAAVESVLDQSYDQVSVWVIDDGSTDGTWSTLAHIDDPRVHLRHTPNRGKAAAMNDLLDWCDTTYVAMQDADDLSHPDRAARIVEAFTAHPDIALLLSGYDASTADGRSYSVVPQVSPEEAAELVRRYRLPSHDPTMAVRTEIARAVRFNPHFRIGQGVDFVWRVGEQYKVAVIPQSLYTYQLRTDSITRARSDAVDEGMSAVFAAALERRTGECLDPPDAKRRFGIRTDPLNNLYGMFTMATKTALLAGERGRAIRIGLDSLARVRMGRRYVKPILYAIAGPSFARWRR